MSAFDGLHAVAVPGGPNRTAVQAVLDGMMQCNDDSPAWSFYDIAGQGVSIPRKVLDDGRQKAYFPDVCAQALWALRCGSIVCDEAGTTLYARDTDPDYAGAKMETWHQITDVISEFGGSTTMRGGERRGWNTLIMVMARQSNTRMREGIKWADRAYYRAADGSVQMIQPGDPMMLDPFVATIPVDWDQDLCDLGWRVIRWLTADAHSADNMLYSLADAFLAPRREKIYQWYGAGGDGKGRTLSALEAQFPVLVRPMSAEATMGSDFTAVSARRDFATARVIYDSDSAQLGLAQEEMIKKLATGDPIATRSRQEDTVMIRSKATPIVVTNHPLIFRQSDAMKRRLVNIKFAGKLRENDAVKYNAFLETHGIAPMLMAACALAVQGWHPWADVIVADADDLTDAERAVVDAICDRGYVYGKKDLDGVPQQKRKEIYTKLGLKPRKMRIAENDHKSTSVMVVADESVFAPYREQAESQIVQMDAPEQPNAAATEWDVPLDDDAPQAEAPDAGVPALSDEDLEAMYAEMQAEMGVA